MGIINRNLVDESSLAVAINNLVALKGPKDISDSLRKLDRLIEKGSKASSFQLSNGLESKLSAKQRETIYTNRVLLLLHSNRMDQVFHLGLVFLYMIILFQFSFLFLQFDRLEN